MNNEITGLIVMFLGMVALAFHWAGISEEFITATRLLLTSCLIHSTGFSIRQSAFNRSVK